MKLALLLSALFVASVQCQPLGQITGVRLINSMTENAIMTLTSGAVIALDAMSPTMSRPSFNLNATINGTDIRSVRFGYGSKTNYHTSNTPGSLSFCGHKDKDFFRCSLLEVGTHTVTVTPFTGRNADGRAGKSVVYKFTIVEKSPVVVKAPTKAPTKAPVAPTKAPKAPTKGPTKAPSTAAPIVTTKAPVTKIVSTDAPTKAPVAVAVPVVVAPTRAPLADAAAPTPVALQGCFLRDLKSGNETLLNSAAYYTVNPTNDKGYSIRCDIKAEFATEVDFVKFGYNGIEHDEFGEPRWLDGDSFPTDYVVPVAYLSTCGVKKINIEAHSWSALRFVMNYTLIAECPVATTPTLSPVVATVPTAPAPPTLPQCSIPKLVGTWQSRPSHFPVAEAQGAIIGTDMLIIGGFTAGYGNVTTQTHAFDTSNPAATWVQQDDYPFAMGITHAAFVVVGTKFYMCGGYAGGGIGNHADVCMVYDHSQPKGQGKQWQLLPPLPQGRAGGGMVHDSRLNALIFSAGATRAKPQTRTAVDHHDTWSLSLGTPNAQWVAKAPMPFHANHMSSVTARDETGKERHYFTGGQKEEDEHDGNQAEHFEYDAIANQWFARTFMTLPRSHAASSTRAIGCGFIMVAGCTNGGLKISDISYYDVPTDTWTKIGDLSSAINTPVCDISNGNLFCATGWDSGRFARNIGITL